jgi:SAM-dependent methyltransferase
MSSESVTRNTYSRIAPAHSARTRNSPLRPLIEQAILMTNQDLPKCARVLLVGSGDGRDAALFTALGHRAYCLDYAHTMNLLCQEALGADASLVTGDMRWLPYTHNTFDCVWASMCIYHLQRNSLNAWLTQVSTALRPQGTLYLNYRPGRGAQMKSHAEAYPSGGERLYTFYSQEEILLAAHGFEAYRTLTDSPTTGSYLAQCWFRSLRL